MADYISGITPIPPTYPVRPGQPVNKDRDTGKRRKKEDEKEHPPRSVDEPAAGDDHDDKPAIDEHV